MKGRLRVTCNGETYEVGPGGELPHRTPSTRCRPSRTAVAINFKNLVDPIYEKTGSCAASVARTPADEGAPIMPFLVFDEIEKETVTPKYSTAYGELVIRRHRGRAPELQGRRGRRGACAPEQVMYIISGKLAVDLEGEHAELGPGSGLREAGNTGCRRSRTLRSSVRST